MAASTGAVGSHLSKQIGGEGVSWVGVTTDNLQNKRTRKKMHRQATHDREGLTKRNRVKHARTARVCTSTATFSAGSVTVGCLQEAGQTHRSQ